jgi:hypothetical protein
MTIAEEMVKVGGGLIINDSDQLWLPHYVASADLINTTIPTEVDLVTQSETQKYPLGARVRKNGRIYRYCKGGATMGSGHQAFLKVSYTQCPGKAGNSGSSGFEGALYAAVSAGDTSFTIADTAAAKNLYEDAFFQVYNDTDAVYESHRIIGNDVDNDTYTTCYIEPPGFKKALTTSMGITIYLSPYGNVRSALSVNMNWSSAIGYAQFPITSGYFFWLQTAGRVSGVAFDGGYTTGITAYRRTVYANTDGSIIDAGSSYYQPIGYLLSRTASDYADNFIMLTLDDEA